MGMSPQASRILSSIWIEPLVGEAVSSRGPALGALTVGLADTLSGVFAGGFSSEPQPTREEKAITVAAARLEKAGRAGCPASVRRRCMDSPGEWAAVPRPVAKGIVLRGFTDRRPRSVERRASAAPRAMCLGTFEPRRKCDRVLCHE